MPEIVGHDDVGEGPEHGDEFGDVDEGGEAADRLVLTGWLDFEFGRRITEAGCPGVEFVQPTVGKGVMAEQALDREHFSERIGDRGAGGENQCPAGVPRLDVAGFDIEIPGALRAVRVDALQCRHVGSERQLAEFLCLVDDDLVDTDFRDGQKIVLAGGEAFEPILQTLLQPLETLTRDTILAVDLGQQVLVKLKLVLDHLLFEGRRHGDKPEGRMRDDDRVPGCRRRA